MKVIAQIRWPILWLQLWPWLAGERLEEAEDEWLLARQSSTSGCFGNRESSLEGPDYYTLARALRLPWLRLDCGVAAEASLRLT